MRNRKIRVMSPESARNEKAADSGAEESREPVAGPSGSSDDNHGKISKRTSRDTEEESRSGDASKNISFESPSSVPSPTDANKSQSETPKYFSCDMLPDVTAAPTEFKSRRRHRDSESTYRNYKKYRKTSYSKERTQYHEDSHEEWCCDDDVKSETLPVYTSLWKPNYTDPVKPKGSDPFYYSIPSNPAQVNVLPPGNYLVIPQNKLCESPLKVYHHPEVQTRSISAEEKSSRTWDYHYKEGREDFKNPPKSSRQKDDGNEERVKTVEIEGEAEGLSEAAGYEDPIVVEESEGPYTTRVDYLSALSYTSSEYYKPPNTIEIDSSGEKILSLCFDSVSFLKRRVPYCDIEEIRKEWSSRKYPHWRDFVMRMRELKVLEVLKQLLKDFPLTKTRGLKREIRGILSNYNSVQEVVAAMKQKKQEELAQESMAQESEVDVSKVNEAHSSLEGETSERKD